MAFSTETQDLIKEHEEIIKAAKAADKEARTVEGPKKSKSRSLSTVDLQRIARQCVDTYFSHHGEPTVRYWQNNWWHWYKGTWKMTTLKKLSGLIAAFATMAIDSDDPNSRGLGLMNLNRLDRDEILCFMQPLVGLGDEDEFQTWLPAHSAVQKDLDVSGTWVSTTSGLLRCADADTPLRLDPTPRYFTPCCLPRIYDHTPTKEWEPFLNEIFQGDQERIGLLQEWFGYCCLPSTRFQRMMFMIGGGSNGKSVVLHVLKRMLGRDNCSSASLTQLNGRFGLAATFGKLANICADTSTRYLKDPAELKAFIAGDDMEFERKFCDTFSTEPTARIVFSMNRIPKTDDDSHGWWRRLLILPFDFTPKTENPLYASPKSPHWPFRDELDQIFAWSMQGLQRLLCEKDFSPCEASKRTLEQWRFINENVRRYREERLTYEPGAEWSTPIMNISKDYERWCNSLREKPFAVPEFSRKLHAILGGLNVIQKKFGQAKKRHWVGLRISDDAPTLGDA